MSFIKYDIIFLIFFVLLVALFLYLNRKNLKKQGWLFLYQTKWGINLINYAGKKYRKTLNALSYFSIVMGYVLMITMIYLFGKVVWLYLFNSEIVRAIKVPPIMPFIPYLPQIFKLDFLPPIYFTYWIIILAVIAITHEFCHGIFAVHNKLKIKRTGFGFFPFFLPIFLAAFVEINEEKMKKKSKFAQMAILSAGTFANLLTTILFLFVIWLFFSAAFIPAGIEFNTYSYSAVKLDNIEYVNGIAFQNRTYENFVSIIKNNSLNAIYANNRTYLGVRGVVKEEEIYALLYDDSPAIRAGLIGAITEIDEKKITNWEEFGEELKKNSPGKNISIKTKTKNETLEYTITLEKNPENESLAWLGIGIEEYKISGITEKIFNILSFFKISSIYYEPRWEFSWFVYNLLWWIILINISVALVNMLPVGIFDGGRFFYLTVLGITKNEKIAKRTFSALTWLFILILLIIMISWILSF